MGLLRRYLAEKMDALCRSGMRVSLVGRRDRLPAGMADHIARAETRTAAAPRLHLRIAFDYSGREAILAAARSSPASVDREAFDQLVSGDDAGDVDLLIRTGGEKRLSDFLLRECAYAEMRFVDHMWPDFSPNDLRAALEDLATRQRRFGGLVEQSVAA